MIPLDNVALLFRGWRDKKSRLRVIAESTTLKFSAFCSVYEAVEESVVFAIEGNALDLIEFTLVGCNCDFAGAPRDGEELPVGGKVESAILVVRGDFSLTVCLLA